MDHRQRMPACERLLDQVVDCLTPSVARRIVDLRMDLPVQVRLIELSQKVEAGSLTEIELWEYRVCLEAIDIISRLQEKAQAVCECR